MPKDLMPNLRRNCNIAKTSMTINCDLIKGVYAKKAFIIAMAYLSFSLLIVLCDVERLSIWVAFFLYFLTQSINQRKLNMVTLK